MDSHRKLNGGGNAEPPDNKIFYTLSGNTPNRVHRGRPTDMKFGSFRQRIGLTFFIVSAIVSLLCDYIWAYHLAPYDAEFPTPWSVFELNASISAVIVCATTALFAVPLIFVKTFAVQLPTASDHGVATCLAASVQPLIFVSPHITDRFNPVLGILVIAPLVAGFVFVATRKRPPTAKCKTDTSLPPMSYLHLCSSRQSLVALSRCCFRLALIEHSIQPGLCQFKMNHWPTQLRFQTLSDI